LDVMVGSSRGMGHCPNICRKGQTDCVGSKQKKKGKKGSPSEGTWKIVPKGGKRILTLGGKGAKFVSKVMARRVRFEGGGERHV